MDAPPAGPRFSSLDDIPSYGCSARLKDERFPPILPQEATKSAPPFAGSAGRCAILDPVVGRSWCVDVIKTETIIMFISDQINELRAELAGCVFTKVQRARLEAELIALIAEREAAAKAEADAVPKAPPGVSAGC